MKKIELCVAPRPRLDDDGFSGGRGREKEASSFIEAQNSCVCFNYTHNFQISAFALHIKIFPFGLLYVKSIFLCQSLGSAIMVLLLIRCWQKVDDEENIIWHFGFRLHPPSRTLSRPISQALERYKCTISSYSRSTPHNRPFTVFLVSLRSF